MKTVWTTMVATATYREENLLAVRFRSVARHRHQVVSARSTEEHRTELSNQPDNVRQSSGQAESFATERQTGAPTSGNTRQAKGATKWASDSSAATRPQGKRSMLDKSEQCAHVAVDEWRPRCGPPSPHVTSVPASNTQTSGYQQLPRPTAQGNPQVSGRHEAECARPQGASQSPKHHGL